MAANPPHLGACTAPSTSPSNSDLPPHDPAQLIVERRRQCEWCTNTFPIVRRPGRPRIYCAQACRQRAYERRKGLGVLPPPDRIYSKSGGPLAHLRPKPARYESGRADVVSGKVHAMRPAGIADGLGRRLTLCGLLAHVSAPVFGTADPRACLTCSTVAEKRPPGRPVQLSNDLAALRALIESAAVELSRTDDERARFRPRRAGDIVRDLISAA